MSMQWVRRVVEALILAIVVLLSACEGKEPPRGAPPGASAAELRVVRRGVLEVFVSHSAHVQELGFHKHAIVARLRELLPDAGITDIRCRLLADAGRST